MFVIQIHDLFFEQFSLEHIFDDEFFRILYFVDDLLQFLGLEHCVWFDYGDCEWQVELFWIEKGLFHNMGVIFL